MLALQFALSTFVHLERTCKYWWPCSTFCWDQTQFHRSSIPGWILVWSDWGQKGSIFFRKSWLFSSLSREYSSSSFNFLNSSCSAMLVSTLEAFISYFYWYHYTRNRTCGTWTRRAWNHFAFPYCGLRPKLLSYLSLFLFLYLCFFLFFIYMLDESSGIPFLRIWI